MFFSWAMTMGDISMSRQKESWTLNASLQPVVIVEPTGPKAYHYFHCHSRHPCIALTDYVVCSIGLNCYQSRNDCLDWTNDKSNAIHSASLLSVLLASCQQYADSESPLCA